jgi:hypothetical protein
MRPTDSDLKPTSYEIDVPGATNIGPATFENDAI